jgi:hypothetical protein
VRGRTPAGRCDSASDTSPSVPPAAGLATSIARGALGSAAWPTGRPGCSFHSLDSLPHVFLARRFLLAAAGYARAHAKYETGARPRRPPNRAILDRWGRAAGGLTTCLPCVGCLSLGAWLALPGLLTTHYYTGVAPAPSGSQAQAHSNSRAGRRVEALDLIGRGRRAGTGLRVAPPRRGHEAAMQI